MNKELSKELHNQLLSEKTRLENEIANISGVRGDVFLEDESDSVDQHPADDGTELFEREKNLTVRRTLEVSLDEINQALTRFDAGTYGLCELCGKPISEKRLRAMPGATHCIDCQAKLEKQAQAVGH